MHTIGEHIFQIKLEDIAPAEKAALVPYEQAHALPLEMDLQRLAVRSQNLDETLNLLKSSRLDDVVNSLDSLKKLLASHSIGEDVPGSEVNLCVAPGDHFDHPNQSGRRMLGAIRRTRWSHSSLAGGQEFVVLQLGRGWSPCRQHP